MEQLYLRAQKYATLMGWRGLATDFAAWLVIEKLEGRRRAQKLSHSFIDFLRVTRGSPRAVSQDAMLHARSAVNIERVPLFTDPLKFYDIHKVVRSLPKRLGLILRLKIRGYTQNEIAKKLHLTESRVCQLEKRAIRLCQFHLGIIEDPDESASTSAMACRARSPLSQTRTALCKGSGRKKSFLSSP